MNNVKNFFYLLTSSPIVTRFIIKAFVLSPQNPWPSSPQDSDVIYGRARHILKSIFLQFYDLVFPVFSGLYPDRLTLFPGCAVIWSQSMVSLRI